MPPDSAKRPAPIEQTNQIRANASSNVMKYLQHEFSSSYYNLSSLKKRIYDKKTPSLFRLGGFELLYYSLTLTTVRPKCLPSLIASIVSSKSDKATS